MPRLLKIRVGLTTNGSGVGSALSEPVHGRLIAFRMLGSLTTPDVTLTDQDSGIVLYTKAAISNGRFYPRVQVQTAAGADATLDGTRPMLDTPIVYGPVSIGVENAGNDEAGAFELYVEED